MRSQLVQVRGAATQHQIKLIKSEEGWAVSCPALRGCHSQGATREEAVKNIKFAIREWLAEDELDKRARGGSRQKFEAALAQVPNVPPMRGDEI